MIDIHGKPVFLEDSLANVVSHGRKRFDYLKTRIEKEFKKTPLDYVLSENLALLEKRLFIVALIEQIKQKENYKLLQVANPHGRLTLKIANSVKGYNRLLKGLILGFYISVARTRFKAKNPGLNALELAFSTTRLACAVDQLLFPPAVGCTPKQPGKAIRAVLLSDVHIGSKTFCRTNFEQLLAKINRDSSIGYVIIAGDVCDGIGVYPEHETDLLYRCFKAQYHQLGLLLASLRQDIVIILSPGNHDYTSKVEPQEFGDQIKTILQSYRSSIYYVSNPGYFELEGLRYLIFHGASYNAIISSTQQFSCDRPWQVSGFVLDTRLLSPIPGITPIRPTTQLFHVVPDVVDIFHTGHLHSTGFAKHSSGATIVCTGTWQHLTPYMDLLGYKPAIATCTVINLADLNDIVEWVLVDSSTQNYNYKVASLKEPLV